MSVWEIHKPKGEIPQDGLIDSYWWVLKKYKLKQIQDAFGYALTSLKWFPKPVELIQYIEKPKELIAQTHAGYLINAVRGREYKNPDGWKEDPETKQLLQGRFDIERLHQNSMESDLKWIEKDFIEAYLDIAGFVNSGNLQIDHTRQTKQLISQGA